MQSRDSKYHSPPTQEESDYHTFTSNTNKNNKNVSAIRASNKYEATENTVISNQNSVSKTTSSEEQHMASTAVVSGATNEVDLLSNNNSITKSNNPHHHHHHHEKRKINIPVAGCAALGGFLFGYDTAVVNGAVFQMKDHFDFGMDSWQAGLIVSIAVIGAFLGSIVAGEIASRWGRWFAILSADVLFLVGSILLAIANSLDLVYVGRLVLGLGIGLASVTIPVYLAEMSPAETRGKVITVNNFFITGAQFVASVVCAMFVEWTSKNVGWRWMFGLGAVPAALQLIGLLAFLPETPRFLHSKGRLQEADAIADKFGIEKEEEEDHVSSSGNSQGGGSGCGDAYNLSELLSPKMKRRLFIGIGLQLFQQLSGINTIMYYSSAILKNAGFEGDTAPVLWSMPLAATNAFFTLVGMFMVDNWGRKSTLFKSLTGCLLCTILMTVFGFLHTASVISTETSGWLFLVTLMFYLMSFAPGMGPIPWIMNAELFPTRLRASSAAICTMANWASNAIVSQSFPILMGSAIGTGGTFLIISLLIWAAMIFVRFVPETKQLTLEEIDELFDNHMPSSATVVEEDRTHLREDAA